jgi:hypothetical protein
MQFSPDGHRFAYYRIDGQGQAQWIVDGAAHPLVNDVRPIGLAQLRGVAVLDPPLPALFSPDSRRFAYWADVLEKGVAIVVDGVPGERYELASIPAFSPDSGHIAYSAMTFEKRETLVLDGEPRLSLSGAHTGGGVLFSADSQHVHWTYERDERSLFKKRRMYGVVLDGVAFPAHEGEDASLRAALSPDGTQVAWWLQRGAKGILMINGAAAGSDADLTSDTFYTASGRLVFAGRWGRSSTTFVDGRPGPLADDLRIPSGPPTLASERGANFPFRTSPDGEHVAWAGRFGDVARPVLDDRVGPAFDSVLDWSIRPDGTATWTAMREGVIQRVTTEVR